MTYEVRENRDRQVAVLRKFRPSLRLASNAIVVPIKAVRIRANHGEFVKGIWPQSRSGGGGGCIQTDRYGSQFASPATSATSPSGLC